MSRLDSQAQLIKELKEKVNQQENEIRELRAELQVCKSQQSDGATKGLVSLSKELIGAICKQLERNRLPAIEPDIFDGNIMEYYGWKYSFEALIENDCCNNMEKLYYLKKYTSGEAKQAISAFMIFKNEESHNKAINRLDKRFGDKHILGQDYMKKLDEWPPIPLNDGHALMELVDFLNCIKVAKKTEIVLEMETIALDVHEGIAEHILPKLSQSLINSWIDKMVGLRCTDDDEHGGSIFPPFCEFLERQAYIRIRYHNSRFDDLPDKCLFCESEYHGLEVCKAFQKSGQSKQQSFIMRNKLCFKCLGTGHKSAECEAPLTCSLCSRLHPSCLHRL